MHASGLQNLTNKHILLGVSGSIAAYKAAELVRRLREAGAEVRVVLTAGGREFVTPLTFQALSGNPVHQDLLDTGAEAAMGHIELARWADAIMIAPASANLISRLAQGRADDLLSAISLASDAPLAVAPAMNQQMWAHAATRDNLAQLARLGVHQFGPGSGDQACGETGPGRMLEADELLQHLAGLFETGLLAGRRVLVTAGPTREAIDPVRYLSNRSSGRMGYAIAQAAAEAGASTLLVSGPCQLATPPRVERIDVSSAREMHEAVMQHAMNQDVFIATAAVADYRPAEAAAQKIKKDADEMSLKLVRNPDILKEVAAMEDAPFCVGFAAETENLQANAEQKFKSKKLDMVVANQVGDDAGFDKETNILSVISAEGTSELGEASKYQLARQLIGIIAQQLAKK